MARVGGGRREEIEEGREEGAKPTRCQRRAEKREVARSNCCRWVKMERSWERRGREVL